jgi:hypothetical protein
MTIDPIAALLLFLALVLLALLHVATLWQLDRLILRLLALLERRK